VSLSPMFAKQLESFFDKRN